MAQDPSGYGAAARSYVNALYLAGINITTEIIKQMGEATDYGISGAISNALKDRNIDYDIKIIHLTPDLYPQYIEDDKYNIGHLFWETDKLPREWVKPLNMVSEIWTASENMAKMISDSGVATPIRCFPQPIDLSLEKLSPFITQYPKDFIFYSIFQWIARKNPRTLLRAYWKEFSGNENVTLLLKTYRVNYSEKEYDLIKYDIDSWKRELNLKHYPKIFLVEKLLTEKEVQRLHLMGDCFIQPSSGEGWSRPTHEAMLYGKPVISGDNGGLTDYLTDDLYYKVESKEVPVTVQSFIPWYQSGMNWKELDEKSLREKMRKVYENYPEAVKTAREAKNYIEQKTTLDIIGQMMENRIDEICRENVKNAEEKLIQSL
ncbi:MAG: glycosyltransferase [Actinobacteria bacterium]|nr:glycosyltransferase [Actinomycetota bacterium]